MDGTESSVSSIQSGAVAAERQIQQAQQAEMAKQVRSLASRDREVRAHEQAHAAVGGKYAGAPRYEFERGPNGVSYAVAGSVSIDVAPVANDPAATLAKMQTVQRAAMAPAQPSSADRAIAAKATAQAAEARAELASKRVEERQEEGGPAGVPLVIDTRGGSVDVVV